MKNLILPLVNWGMGAAIIGVFAVVSVIMILIVSNMIKGDKNVNDDTSDKK
ncbi:hypothetical protein GCM10022393_34190 [Aquimarina addita]|uniref:DUF3149 domain-containing protein n=1 Tax=Aquimarina addita TaxID=870485 RepID=A0ABP6UPX7_9FLAO